jgi:hypothetical protein
LPLKWQAPRELSRIYIIQDFSTKTLDRPSPIPRYCFIKLRIRDENDRFNGDNAPPAACAIAILMRAGLAMAQAAK